jgi:hypothetical protein
MNKNASRSSAHPSLALKKETIKVLRDDTLTEAAGGLVKSWFCPPDWTNRSNNLWNTCA